MTENAEVVIVGAGMAGIACAYHLAARRGIGNVILVDEREPLTLTSDKGTQAYRNWWPGPDDTMLRFISRSIGILEEMADECGNHFRLNRRGYVFLTGRADGLDRLRAAARTVSAFGMGPLREHGTAAPPPAPYRPAPAEGYRDQPDGADLLEGDALRRAFPYTAPGVTAALHVRRAGWLNAVALGAWMLKRAVGAGAHVQRQGVARIDTAGGRVTGVRLSSGQRIATGRVVIAAGPRLPESLAQLGADLPLFCELHAKLLIRDTRGAVPRGAPFLIWDDPVMLPWSDVERTALRRRGDAAHVLAEMPGGVHLRTVDGSHGDELYLIWTYDAERRPFVWPPRFDPHYGEAALRGVAAMIPAMAAYAGCAAEGVVDGGYYCKTPENRPLVGPFGASGPEGAFVCGALSGYGIMGSHAAAELLAAHVEGAALPEYAPAFLPARYADAGYRAAVERWTGATGQL